MKEVDEEGRDEGDRDEGARSGLQTLAATATMYRCQVWPANETQDILPVIILEGVDQLKNVSAGKYHILHSRFFTPCRTYELQYCSSESLTDKV